MRSVSHIKSQGLGNIKSSEPVTKVSVLEEWQESRHSHLPIGFVRSPELHTERAVAWASLFSHGSDFAKIVGISLLQTTSVRSLCIVISSDDTADCT